jgi:hypothetical protein
LKINAISVSVSQVLDSESKKLKNHVRVLLEKTGTDDQLIDALREELKSMRERVVKSSLAATVSEPSSPSRTDAENRTMKQTIDQVLDGGLRVDTIDVRDI